jgi:murein L,D-transpeptidase YcbB/YkuD
MEKRDFRESPIIKNAAKQLEHIIILPIFTEPYDVIEEAVLSIMRNDYPYLDRVTILLATEERAPLAVNHAERIIEQYSSKIRIVNIIHP